MAHLIDMNNHRANMAFVGVTPWHGLGQMLTEDAPLEVWAREAGMEHTINHSRVAYRWGADKGQVATMDDKRVLWRSDTKAPLAVVSSKYQIVQPAEILEFYRDLVSTTGDYQLQTAGCLDDGKKYWALAKYKDGLDFGNGDTVKPYLLLATSADGSMATTATHTSIRVVCNNTLQMSLGREDNDSIKISHATKFDAEVVKARLHADNTIATYKGDVDALINKAMGGNAAMEIFVELVAKKDDDGNIINEKSVKRIAHKLWSSLTTAPGSNLPTSRDTAWGVMNAITHYVDFETNNRNNNNRFVSGQFGQGANLKAEAFKILMAA